MSKSRSRQWSIYESTSKLSERESFIGFETRRRRRELLIFQYSFLRMSSLRSSLVEKSGILHIYYANKTFKHWKKRWLHLQDQQLSIYQGKD